MAVSRFLLAVVALFLWLSPARADCLFEFEYEYFLSEAGPAPAESLPCCAATARPFVAAEKDRPFRDRAVPAAFHDVTTLRDATAAGLAGARLSPLPARRYCARSSRLLL